MSDEATSNDELSSADSLENLPKINGDEFPKKKQDTKKIFKITGEASVIIPLDLYNNNDDEQTTKTTETTLTDEKTISSTENNNKLYHKLVFLDDDAKVSDEILPRNLGTTNHDEHDADPRINALTNEISELRARESSLMQQIEILKKIIDEVQLQPLSSTFADDGDVSSSASPRSDRSLSSQFNDLRLKYTLDVFDENHHLLQKREASRRRRDETVQIMQQQIDDLEIALKNLDEHFKFVKNEFSAKENDFLQRIAGLEKELNDKKRLLETFDDEERRSFLEKIERLEIENRKTSNEKRAEGDNAKIEELTKENEKLRTDFEAERTISTGLRLEIETERISSEKIVRDAEIALKREKDEKLDAENQTLKLQLTHNALLAEKNALSEQYNELLQQKSNWQSKIDELKSVRRSQQQFDEEVDRLRTDVEKFQTQLKISNDKFNDLNYELTNAKSNLAAKDEELSHLRKILKEKSKESFKEEYENLTKKYDWIVKENQRLTTENEKFGVKLEKFAEIERAFDAQNLGLTALRKSLEAKDSTIAEFRKRCGDLEQILDENLREKEQKSATVLQVQEQLNSKSNEFEKLESEFDAWKTNANAQFEDTCRKYEEKIADLHSILRKYTDYPGKITHENEEKMEKFVENADVQCDLLTIEKLQENYSKEYENMKISYENRIKMIETKANADYREICRKYEEKINELQNNLVKYTNYPGKSSGGDESLQKERKISSELKLKSEKLQTELEMRKEEFEQMMETIGKLNRRCEHSDMLHDQAIRTIEALRVQYDEERRQTAIYEKEIDDLKTEIENLRCEKINLANEADLSAFGCKIIAERIVEINSNPPYVEEIENLRERLTISEREKRNLNLRFARCENFRRSLVGQKKYLESIIDRFHATEIEALQFMQTNGFSTISTLESHRKTTKFRKNVYAVLATIRIRKKFEKMRRLCQNGGTVSISPYFL